MRVKLAELGKKFYDEHLKQILEPIHNGEFVSIEPESGNYFLGKTDGEALSKSNKAMPDKMFFLLKVGYGAVHKIGGFNARRKR